MAHRSKWGWHPCDYASYLLLKELNALCEKARRRYAAWQRWRRKLPHNRVVRRTLVDERGRRVGAEVVGPRPEPPPAALFCVRRPALTYWSDDGRPLKEGRMIEQFAFEDFGIPAAYREARTPVPGESEAPPPRFTADELLHLVRQAQGNRATG